MASNKILKLNMLSPTILFFLFATLCWTVAWFVYFEILFLFSLYYWFWLLAAMFFLLFTARIRGLKIISAWAWAYPAGLLVILFIGMAYSMCLCVIIYACMFMYKYICKFIHMLKKDRMGGRG